MLYSYYAKTILNIPVSGIIYNILIKSRLKRNPRNIQETDTEYLKRLCSKNEDPSMFHREIVNVTDDNFKNISSHVWDLSKAVVQACESNSFYRNNSNCYNFNKQCEYYSLCYRTSNDTSDTIKPMYHTKKQHSELDNKTKDYSPISTLTTLYQF